MPSINVTVFDSTENKRVPVELPDDAPANKLIAVLVEKLKLPKSGPDGAPLSYKFHHKNSGKQVQDGQTLALAGVKEGGQLSTPPPLPPAVRHPLPPAPETQELKCTCAHCGQKLAFDQAMLHRTIECPACKRHTTLVCPR
jgi:DNA-directed RNA polymerase subunit RPC12/RpoP